MGSIKAADLMVEGIGGIGEIFCFALEERPGEHGHAEAAGRALHGAVCGEALQGRTVSVREKAGRRVLFSGIVEAVHGCEENGYHTVRLELYSGSRRLDLEKKSGSWQDTSMSYGRLVGQAAGEAGAVWPESLDGAAIGFPVIQYGETDWAFIKRMASRFGLPVYPQPGGGGVCVGVPEGGASGPIGWTGYATVQDGQYYWLGGEASGYSRSRLLSYEVESHEAHICGERVLFLGKSLAVCARSCRTEGGELAFTYRLAEPEWAGQRRTGNRKLPGLSLLGTVASREGETVCLDLDIDEGCDKGHYPFQWAPATGNLMYLVPSVGSRVSLYFKGNEETGAVAVNCVRREGEGGGNAWQERSLAAEGGKELKLHPRSLGLYSVDSRVKLDDLEGISIEGKGSLRIAAAGQVRIEGREVDL